jgi:hypothetical protein
LKKVSFSTHILFFPFLFLQQDEITWVLKELLSNHLGVYSMVAIGRRSNLYSTHRLIHIGEGQGLILSKELISLNHKTF